ncbi:arylsulfatase A-like enzyme [Kribbella sp. VKM Ac-2571]|uniref:sulfatase-like hydrolase/transferase n=1 Tax=Kribbella sp. VKM Ac-2571 TaxID=2512222 RepID=UPI00105CC572|nr:sulfatase-like hydrolase/transferase [Kribbella sp. VKM Ac-2571]TDO50336.1 arylsulfatase A-like enzyme [Kribbella sp. VKM Ac-2571]
MRPNVIVFFTDQQRWDTVGAAGCPLGLTPNLDLMARRGTFFETACTTNPVCAPARAAMQTGMFPTNAGVFRNSVPLPTDAPTLGRLFGDAGYRTAYIGKWHLGTQDPVPAEEQAGYEYWLASNLLEFTSDAYRTVVYDGHEEPVFLPGYRPDALTDAAIRYVTRVSADDRPFMLFLSLIEPHHQNEHDNYPAPEVYRDTYTGAWLPPDLATLPGTAHQHAAGYYGQIKRVDECLGRLRDALVSLDLADDTLLLYTSDHGSHFKTRNSEYKRSPHDGSVRVPLVVEGPGYRGGSRVTAPVSTVDVVPTLLDAAGIDLPDHLDGVPLRESRRDAVLIQVSESEVGRALRTGRWKYYVHAPDAGDVPGTPTYAERALYDLDADPYELDNLIDSVGHQDVAAELRARLVDEIAAIEGQSVSVTPYPTPRDRGRFPETTVRRLKLDGRRLE